MYAYLLKKLLGFLPNLNFKCLIFNKHDAVLFSPNICLKDLPQTLAKYYDRKYFIPFTDIFSNIRDYILVNWKYLMKLDALHVNNFSDTFTMMMKNIFKMDKTPNFSRIYNKLSLSINELKNLKLNSKQIENLDNLLLINLPLKDLDNNNNTLEGILKFCKNFRLKFLLFANILNPITFPYLKILYKISRFCYLYTIRSISATGALEEKVIRKSKDEITRLVRLGLQESEICVKLQIKSHNTLNQIISSLWFEYKINNLRELRSLFAYLEFDRGFFMDLFLKGLNFEEIEKAFLKSLSKEDLNAIQIGEILKMDERTVRRKFPYHFNEMTLEEVKEMYNPIKYWVIQQEREALQKKIKLELNDSKTKEELKKELDIGDYLFNNLAKEAFNLDLSPSEIKIYKILEKLDESFLIKLCRMNLFTIKDMRLFFIEKLLRDGMNNKEKISNLLHLSIRQIDRLVKEWGKSETFSSIGDKVVSKDANINSYLIYSIILYNRKNTAISDRDKSILNKFKKYNNKYYSLLISKGLNTKQLKRRFIILLSSKVPNSTTAAEIYGFKDRSSLRYEIHNLWDKDTTYTFLKNFAIKQQEIDLDLLNQVKDLTLTNSIRNIFSILNISTWKISEIIAKYCDGKSFSQYRTYLICKKIDFVKLKNLEEKEFAFKKIIIEYIIFLLSKNKEINEISELLKIPITRLERILNKIKESGER